MDQRFLVLPLEEAEERLAGLFDEGWGVVPGTIVIQTLTELPDRDYDGWRDRDGRAYRPVVALVLERFRGKPGAARESTEEPVSGEDGL